MMDEPESGPKDNAEDNTEEEIPDNALGRMILFALASIVLCWIPAISLLVHWIGRKP